MRNKEPEKCLNEFPGIRQIISLNVDRRLMAIFRSPGDAVNNLDIFLINEMKPNEY